MKLRSFARRTMPAQSPSPPDNLSKIDGVLDFTTPQAVLGNIEAMRRSWQDYGRWDHRIEYGELGHVHSNWSKRTKSGFLYGANFSIGINLLFEGRANCRWAPAAHQYLGHIFERHHSQKKDDLHPAPLHATLQKIIRDDCGTEVEITSFREGDVIGMHRGDHWIHPTTRFIPLPRFQSPGRGFSEGAVRAVEWLAGKKGFFDFKDVWREI